MKLKTRIFLSFFLIILIPILLMSMLVIGDTLFYRSVGASAYNLSSVTTVQELQSVTRELVIAMVMILVITGLILSLWLYRGIMTPLLKLTKATKNIYDGNLDFHLETDHNVQEVDELCKAFEEMRIKLKEANESKIEFDKQNRELISNISHDLRTPITAVKGYCEGLIDGVADTPEKQERYVRTIYNKANEMDRLIGELSFYSKITTNRIPYIFNKVNVRQYFDDAAEEFKPELQSKNVLFFYSNTVKETTEVIADAEQIQRVMNNIISNSLKYMDKDEKIITMMVQEINDEIQVSIKDNGKGIEAKNLSHIFDRFYRTDSSRNSAMGGSGIGLSIVKKILEDHGGRVWVNSTEGEDTTIYFVLRKYTDKGKQPKEEQQTQVAKKGKPEEKQEAGNEQNPYCRR